MADSLFTDEELQELSDELAFARTSVCKIIRHTRVKDSGGAYKETWAQVGPDVGCRIESQSRLMQEGILGGRLSASVYYDVSFARGTDIGPSDRINADGTMLEVTGVPGLETFAAEITVATVMVDQ